MSDSSPHPAGRRLRECAGFHHIPFRPVPVKPRHDGWTAERQRGFIDRLAVTGCVAVAARGRQDAAKRLPPARPCRRRKLPRRMGPGARRGQSYMIDVGLERALLGQSFPIVRNGRCVGERIRYDNRLAMTALNAMDRRAARSTARDQAAALERYFDLLEEKARKTILEK